MGSNCCKNALDKVRPAPAAHDDASSFDIGGPPDPAAPWPGDTFCRAPAAQAPPVFPEGALDDSLLPEIDELRNQTSAASEVVAMLQQQQQQQQSGGLIGRRTSAPAGSGSTAASLPDTQQQQQQQQRTHRIFSIGEASRRHSPPFGGRGIGEDISSPYSSNPRRGARPTTTTTSAAVGENDDCLLDDSTADGSQRLRTRFHEALRASSRRLRSRLLRIRTSNSSSSSKPGEAGRSNNDSNNEGDKALFSTGATATSFPPDAAIIDDTHFVCYPPASTPLSSSECLSQGWPSAASSPWAEGVPAGDDESATAAAAAAAREVEMRGRGTNTSQFISGEGVVTTAPSRRTPTPCLPPFPSGVELNTDVSNDKGQVHAHELAAEGMRGGREGDGRERKSKTNENRGVNAASAQKQHGDTSTTSTTTRDTGFLKRSRGSNAASSFRRAAVEVVSLPRWRGNNRVSGGGSKKEQKDQGAGTTRPSEGSSSSSNSSSSSSKGGDGGGGAQEEEEGKNKLKKRKNLISPGRQGRFSFKGSRNSTVRKNNDADRTAAVVRSSHCSSASTAAQEEDDCTAMGVEHWWTTNASPSQQAAHEYTQPQTATHDFIFSCGSTPSQQPVGASDILRQAQQQRQQQQLASDCAVPLITGQTVSAAGAAGTAAGALRSPQGGPTPTSAAAAVGVSFVAGESNHIEHRTTRPSLLDPPLFQHEIHNNHGGRSGDNHLILLHGDAAGRGEQGGESGRQQMQQSVTNDGSINPITASSVGGQETHSSYADHVEHATTNGSNNIYMSNTSNSSSSGHSSRSPGTRRTEGDLIPLAAAAARGSTTNNGGNRRGGGDPAWITTETSGIPSPPGGATLYETTAQQEHTAKDRQQETEEDDTSRGSNNNPHMPVVSMPFPE